MLQRLSKVAVFLSKCIHIIAIPYTTLRDMLSSLAQTAGLGSLVPERKSRLLAVLLFWAPGKANGVNRLKAEVTIGAILGMVKKKARVCRFQSSYKQPEHICHRWATSAQACQLNSQHFFCWLYFVENAAPDLAITVSARLEELGIAEKAVVQCGYIVTTTEGRVWTLALSCQHTFRIALSPPRGKSGQDRVF